MDETKSVTSSSGKTMLKGAAIISGAGIAVKIIGAFFRIPLTNWIGEIGMSYYSVAYNIYAALIVMATSGFPVALSRMVSENIAVGRNKNAHKVFKVFLVLMAVSGLLFSVICFFGAEGFTSYLGNPLAAKAVKAVAPAIVLVSLLSAFRGYFQGQQNMNPTALTEILEQLIRVVFGLSLAGILIKSGLDRAAAGASFGATAGALAGLAFIIFIYALHKKNIEKRIARGDQSCDPSSKIIKKIFMIAIPIIIGAEIIPIMNSIDMVIVLRRLQVTGWTEVEAQTLYAIISAFCNPLIGLPQILIQAIAISIVPAITSSVARKSVSDTKENAELGFRLTTFIAAPCVCGLFFLARPILHLVYPLVPDGAEMAVIPLMILSVSILFIALYNTSTAILQAVNRQWYPVVYLAIGVLAKIPISFITVGIKAINIKGTCTSTVLAFAIAAILNMWDVRKHLGIKFEASIFVKPIIASVVMGIAAFGTQKLLALLIGGRLSTVIAVLVAVLVYAVIVIVFRVITPQDMKMLPKGEKLNALIRRFIRWED